MPNITYNGASADPRGNYEPQGFLAGYNYQDRLNDFAKQRDLANMSTQLQNEGTSVRNADFVSGQGARDMQYTQQEGVARNAIALQPGENQLATMNQQGDIASAPGQNNFKVWQSIQALPEAKKAQQLKDTLTTATVLRGLPQNSDPTLAVGILDKLGIDTSRWKGKDPARVQKELQFMRSLDPETFKQFHEIEKQDALIKSNEKIHKGNNDTSRYVADTMSKYREKALTNTPTARADRMDAQAQVILSVDPSEWTPEEHAFMKVWQTRANEPFNKAGAGAQGKKDSITGALDALQPKRPQSTPNNLPPGPVSNSGNKMTIPNVGEVEVLGKEGNRVRIRDPKTGKTGWYTP